MPSSATPANQKPSSGPPPPPGAGMGPVLVQALWDYPGPGNTAAQGDLTFKVGDTVEVVERTNADWWLGRMGGEVGLFPSGFVREVGQGGREGGAWAAGERPGAGGPGLGQARKPWGMRFAEMGV
ncbi:hypothetical protein EX30DRAFT_399008 [Ascodesmis nigricans]|uniref:SH3 domain-containing protein n=1 Tax=Ascodesmis nigricans TaxID=341454 RepID=A0A4S2MIP3_9PEZI|nr:hypothetical protein EX30DRAFT_399008 [Ascodesmis nigricans]